MNRKLIALNLVLAGVLVFAGVQLRKQWKASREREQARIGAPVKPLPAPPYQALEPQPAVIPAGYIAVAKQTLFDKSRDSTVFVEPPLPPPPPPPMPALPVYHGMMNFGSEPIALLSLGGSGQKGIKPGEQIGQFTLLSVDTEVIAFDWKGQTVKRNTAELSAAGRGIPQQQAAETATRTEGPAVPPPPQRQALIGLGEDLGGFRACNVNDGNADGSVIDGYRKVSYNTPFGKACRWER